MGNNKPLLAHLCLFGSGAFWGLMAPVGKDAMTHGIEGIDMVSFRVLGGAILFWLTSLFTRREHIPTTDIIKLAGAGLFGLVFNQCCYGRIDVRMGIVLFFIFYRRIGKFTVENNVVNLLTRCQNRSVPVGDTYPLEWNCPAVVGLLRLA